MDYDDQMIYAYNILRRSPETLRYFQNCYPYICVDEAQDTSKIQHAIIALLAGRTENLFMVGDEDQSIYGFRAAYPEALLSFEQNHPNAKVLLMEENFRSNAKIVEAADRFIQRNTMRHEKRMKAVREAGAELKEIELRSRFGQYNYLLKVADGCQTQTAVLYRDNESILPLVDRLEREKIPYRMRNAELTFFTNRVVLDIQNIICFAEDPKNTELFMQIYYKISTYINKQTAIQICKISEKKNMDVLEAAIRYGNLTANLQRNCRNIQSSLKEMMSGNAEAAVTRIVQYLGYGDYLERAGMSDSKIFILKAIAKNEESPERLVDRLTELQSIIKEKENDPDCPFILSTIHASKGLEYDTVYLMDVADGIFPESVPENLKQADRKELENYEEERRLFYVGVTRAKNILCIFKLNQQSTFLRELLYKPGTKMQQSKTTTGAKNAGIITVQKPVKKQKKVWNQEDYNKFQNEIGEGVIVKHKKFGQGVVVEADGKFVVLQFGDIQKKCVLKTLYENDLLTV
jgi:DNA helicase-2/ATP-dependent DNA helicase PcrA